MFRKTTFKDFVTLQRGFDLPAHQREEGEYPVVASTSITGTHSEWKVEPPGVVTGRSGALGEVQYITTRFWPLNTALWVKDFKGNDPHFVYYKLKTLDLKRFNSGAGVPTLNRNDLDTLQLEIPDLPAQRRIASILSAYDDLIENNTRRIAILEEMARRVYEEWFVHFRFPGHEQVKMVESELGLIPEGWKTSFSDHVDFLEGPGLRNWQYREAGIPFLNIRTLVSNDIDLGKVQFLEEEEVRTRYQHFLLSAYDHVVSSSGTLGRIVTIQSFHLPLMLNTSIIRMRPKGLRVGRWLLKSFLRSDYFQNQIHAVATGAAQKNYGPSHLKAMWILAPDDTTAQRFESLVGPLEDLILTLVGKNRNLRTTRDLLLPKLISGELDVSTLPEPEAITT